MTQGTRPRKAADVVDFDAMLIKRSTKPAIVKLGGREWTIRRDLTSEEVVEYWSLLAQPGDDTTYAALALLFGNAETGKAFSDMVDPLPDALSQKIYREVLVLSGLRIAEDNAEEAEGESSAS